MAKDEVLVVGAGPVGLTCAIQLARSGVKCRIIDKNPFQAKDSRAAGIHARTLEVLDDMGILPQILKEGIKVTGINLYSKNSRLVHAQYKGFDTPYCFMIDLPQSQTEHLLLHALEELGVKVHRNTELNHLELFDTHVDVMLKEGERSLTPDTFAYVIGCDGARSRCRHLTNTNFPGDEYPINWVVLDGHLDWPYDSQEMHIFLHEEGLCAFFPLPHDRMRIIIEKSKGDETSPTFEFALKILQKRVSSEVKLHEPSDISPFIIHHRQVTAYKTGRVFLAGDAAHLHSPAGGQGMNTGIQDSYNLAWKLSLVMQGIGKEELLETYHEERHPVAKEVLAITDKLTKMMTTKNSALTFMRDAFMSVIGSFDLLKEQLPKRFSQLYIRYQPSSIIIDETNNHPPTKVKIGGRAPDHLLMQGEKEISFFDLFKGFHHTLLLFGGKKPTSADLKTLSSFYPMKHPHIRTYFIHRNENELAHCPDKTQCLLDLEPSAHTHYGIDKLTAILVRPDGYIGYIQEPLSLKRFENYLKKIFKQFDFQLSW
ncbi:MAG: FAD-dependent monooxygenase [Chlamydiia bacterium]|nr:FAD-dependent monooxygenase [Chlamydiia bacterium]